jgi:transcriptional repressor NF-X1
LNINIDPKTTNAKTTSPETLADNPLPYSEETLDMYVQLSSSPSTLSTLQIYESNLQFLATSSSQRSIRFQPARAPLRAFIHSLAADWGFKSESFDPDPHRHVLVFKTTGWIPPAFGKGGSIGIRGLSVGECAKMRDRERAKERQLKKAAAEKARLDTLGRPCDTYPGVNSGWAQVASRKRANGGVGPTASEPPFGFGELRNTGSGAGDWGIGTLALRSRVGKGRRPVSDTDSSTGADLKESDDVADDWEEEAEREEQAMGKSEELENGDVKEAVSDAGGDDVAVTCMVR